MPTSEFAPVAPRLAGAGKALYAIVVTAGLLGWLNQESISLYCQQKYHDSCDIPLLSDSDAWRFGARLTQAAESAAGAFGDSLFDTPQAEPEQDVVVLPPAPPTPPTVHVEAPPSLQAAHKVTTPAVTATVTAPHPLPAPAALVTTLQTGDEVFFVGDSLMQGVAPHMANTLRKRYNVQSVNLSKQSTGLAYPGFFNWPRTVLETLKANPKIRLIVVFMGPNDPWDMPEAKGKPFLRFQSAEWEALYRQRIEAIFDQAREHDVQVIWVGPPNMRKDRLSTAMAYLSGLYKSEAEHYGQHYLSANEALGYHDDAFDFYLPEDDGRKVKTRSDDGIHFTPTGQKLIAARVMSMISFPGNDLTEH